MKTEYNRTWYRAYVLTDPRVVWEELKEEGENPSQLLRAVADWLAERPNLMRGVAAICFTRKQRHCDYCSTQYANMLYWYTLNGENVDGVELLNEQIY